MMGGNVAASLLIRGEQELNSHTSSSKNPGSATDLPGRTAASGAQLPDSKLRFIFQ